ncbi:MAG: hypothetical protein ACFFD2_27445, partial [Promethearchaeota archaeon]
EPKKKLKEILENLERTHLVKSEDWKLIIEQNKKEFDKIKAKIKEKQQELTTLVKKKKAITITDEEFDKESKRLQQELYELESQILKLRLKSPNT